jgi:hypothetical protein
MGTLNTEWSGAQYYKCGYDAAIVFHKSLGITIEEVRDARE